MSAIVGASGTGTEWKSDRTGIPTGTSDPGSAAALAVYLQGAAAESWSVSGGSSGMLASDLLTELPKTMNRLRDDN